MTTQEAIKILKSHNRWRRGEDIPAVCPVMLGEAIDQAVKDLEWVVMSSLVGKTVIAETEVKFTPISTCDHKNSKGVNQLYSYCPDCKKHVE